MMGLAGEPRGVLLTIAENMQLPHNMNMSDRKCENCMTYRKGDCAGLRLCDNYVPALSYENNPTKYWPKSMRKEYAGTKASEFDFWPKDVRTVRTKKKKTAVSKPKPRTVKKNKDAFKYDTIKVADTKSARPLLRKFYGELTIWISFVLSGNKYRGIGLLQFKDNVKKVEALYAEPRTERSMLRAFYEAVLHITKPCKVYVIADRPIFERLDNMHEIDYELQKLVVKELKDLGCDVTQVVVDDQSNMIRKHIVEPMLLGEDE